MQGLLKKIVIALLTWEAQYILKKYNPKIIAVTGSMGKTSTKDAIFCILSENRRFVRKSEKSYNSELGVPLTILGLESGWGSPWRWFLNILQGASLMFSREPYPQWLVLEVGADRPGDIRTIAKWLKPDIAVITSIPDIPVHVEFFNSPHALAREKKYLAEYLKHDGMLIINGDDSHTQKILEEFRSIATSFGLGGENAFIASDVGIKYEEKRPVGMHFYSNHSGSATEVALHGALGKPRVYSALAALAVAEVAGISQEEAAQALAAWEPPPGRMRLIEGIRGSLIIDDTYNSSPAAAYSALDTLKEIKGMKKRIAIMGDMLELGRFSKDAHTKVGEHAKKCTDMLITVGFRAKAIGEAALNIGMSEANIRMYDQGESVRAGKEIESELNETTILLIKGSQSMRMEKTVLEIMRDPMHAEELLVRMDPDWKAR
ncbi:MAG: UDP-N-acetylmuramoyl-tripeptide--D-alanyl-D-alanine ligase [Minisyncoccia bacterium]